MTLRIALDGLPLLTPKTGIGHYTARLAAGLRRLPQAPEVHLLYGIHWMRRLRLALRPAGSAMAPGSGRPAAHRPIPWLPEALKTTLKKRVVQIEAAVRRPDLFHATNYVAPRFGGPTVVTVHDLSFMRYPHTHPAERLRWLERHLPDSLAGAARIIADSDFTRREMVSLLAVDADKVTVVPLGVDPVFRPRPASRLKTGLNAYGLDPSGYILSVGTLEPRKNIPALLSAYERLPAEIQERWPLVVAGLRGWKDHQLARRLQRLERLGRLRRLGYVPDAALPLLYAGAALFVYPSLYEGFGLPPLEAMASGVPVIASARASIPEVVGNGGRLFDPENQAELGAAMQRLLTDEQERRATARRGRQRARAFSWQACAQLTYDVYRQAVGQGA